MIFRIVLSISFASQRRKRFVSGQWDNRNSSQFKMVAPVLSDFKVVSSYANIFFQESSQKFNQEDCCLRFKFIFSRG